MNIGPYLRSLREGEGVSQVQLSEAAQTSQSHVSDVENGLDVRLSTLVKYLVSVGRASERKQWTERMSRIVAMHAPMPDAQKPIACAACGDDYPCQTRLLATAG